MNQLSRQAQEAIAALQGCHATCHSMALTYCLEKGGEHGRPQHLRMMLDCAAFCALTADALGHKSQFHNAIAALCAQICRTCGEDCEKLGGMEDCVQACRDCAARCTEIARLDHAEMLAMAVPPS